MDGYIYMYVCVCVCVCVYHTYISHNGIFLNHKKEWNFVILWQHGYRFSSVQSLSRVLLFMIPWTAALQAFLSITNSNSCQLSRWCHPTISSFVVPFSSHLQFFPASGSFPMSQVFASGGQSIRVSASASPVLSMNIQDWFPLGLTG